MPYRPRNVPLYMDIKGVQSNSTQAAFKDSSFVLSVGFLCNPMDSTEDE